MPASALALNNLGAAYIMTADFPAAAAAFERSLAIEPSRSAYSNLGTVYYFLGRYPNAVRMFTRGTELAAQDHRVWGNLADARWQISASRAEARDDYRRAIAPRAAQPCDQRQRCSLVDAACLLQRARR